MSAKNSTLCAMAHSMLGTKSIIENTIDSSMEWVQLFVALMLCFLRDHISYLEVALSWTALVVELKIG